MDRILAVIDNTDRSLELLSDMESVAAGIGAELLVLSLLTTEEFDEHAEVMAAIERTERTTFTQNPREAAAHLGRQAIEDELGSVAYDELLGAVCDEDDRADEVLEIAADHGVDHIAIVGRRRSPTGKAIFGDVAQGVILNFDGYVTVAMG